MSGRIQKVYSMTNRDPRPRPLVRPVAPPLKVMPKQPAPHRPDRINSLRKMASPVSAPPVNVGSGVGKVPVTLIALNTANAHADISSEVSSLQSSLANLQTRSTFNEILSDITDLDTMLNRVVELLESARQEGYRYQNDMEDIAYGAMSRWETVRPQVMSTLQQQAAGMQSRLPSLNPQLQRLNAVLSNPASATLLVRSTQSQVNNLLQDISRIESDLENNYSEIESQAQKLNTRLTNVHWAMDQLAGARFSLQNGEDLVMGVTARWDKEGKDDPEGILYLSNKRLIFERKEKVATKKVLFITTASELVQEVQIDSPLSDVKGIKAENKGLFGHQDFLLVEFADHKLGAVSFHINGQDSKDWASLVDRARSGQIESERLSGSTGISIGDLTRPLTAADIMAIQSEVNALQDEMMMKSAQQELSALENNVRSLERNLAGVRARGYSIEKDLEADIAVLSAQWDRVKSNAEKTIENQTHLLSEQMSSIQQSMAQLAGLSSNLAAARPVYMQLKSTIASAEAQADAAQATVLTQFNEYADEVEGLDAHLDWVDWMLDALSTASFRLLATESGVAAAEAIFQHPSWEAENGILFLTDQRLLWEDRVGTYELKVDMPFPDILDVQKESDEQSGQEALVFKFGPQGAVPVARFQLALPVADSWIKMVGRARTGGYAQDRAVPLSADELDKVRKAPQQCSNCGAAFTAPILRGQTEIRCEYCGLVVRI